MAKTIPKNDTAKLVVSVSLATPAIRTVIVAGYWADDDDNEIQIVPVLAIEARIVQSYWRPYTGKYPAFATVSDLEKLGFRGDSSEVEHDYLIMDPTANGFGLCYPNEIWDASGDSEWEPVVCTWPTDQDAERLERTIEMVRERAIANTVGRTCDIGVA